MSSKWKCARGFSSHDFFISYRVSTDSNVAVSLAAQLSDAGLFHCYLDRQCLVASSHWEQGFLAGLERAVVIVPLVSIACLKSLKPYHDSVVLEWELAIQRHQQGLAKLIPVFIHDSAANSFPSVSDFADELHDHPKSPRQLTLRNIVEFLYNIHGIHGKVDKNGELDSWSLAQLIKWRYSTEIGLSTKEQAEFEAFLDLYRYGSLGSESVRLRTIKTTTTSVTKGSNRNETRSVIEIKVVRHIEVGVSASLEVNHKWTPYPQTTSRNSLLAADITDWAKDIESPRAILVQIGEEELSEMTTNIAHALLKTDTYASTISFQDTPPTKPARDFLLDLTQSLSNSIPSTARELLQKFKSTLPSHITTLSLPALFKFLLTDSTNPSTSHRVVILPIQDMTHPGAQEFIQSVVDNLPQGYKILFVGATSTRDVAYMDSIAGSITMFNVIDGVGGISGEDVSREGWVPGSVVDSKEGVVGVALRGREKGEFVVYYACEKDERVVRDLAMGLRLNGTHNVRVVSWREGCEGLIGDKTFVLFVLSNQAIGVLDDGNSKFIEQVHLCLEQGVHCLPIFLQRDGAEFSIPSLLSYKYSRAEVSPTLRNLLLLQGLRIDTSDAKRSTPRILAARQIVLGLLNTEGVDSNPDKLSQTEMRELYGFLKPSLNEVNQVQKMLLDAIVPETRNWTLNDIKALLEGGHVWVGGEGRVGKSTISALLARELEKRDELAAYFPFSRETQHLATPSDLIQTIAYTLSLRIPPVGRYILSLFQASLIDYSKSNPSSLFLQLIVEPMREVSIYYKFETPLVLILDGLDECGEAGQVDGSGRVVRSEDLVGIMEKCVPLLPAECIRVVAFSRITDAYVNVFKEWGSWFEVQVTDERNKGDVELVAEMLLERSGVQDGLDRQKMIELLVRKSGGLIEWVVDVVGVLKETGLTVEAFEKLEQTALVKYSKITQIK